AFLLEASLKVYSLATFVSKAPLKITIFSSKEGTLRGLFPEEQAKIIGSIPLGNALQPDKRVWRGDKLGEYTTKNRYKRCVKEDLNLLRNEITTYLEQTRNYYSKIWNLKIPSKQMTVTLPPIHDNQEWKQWLAETFNINNAYKSTCLAVSLWAIWHNMNKYYHEEANGTAHAMAAWGRGSDSSAFWVEETPLESGEDKGSTKLRGTRKMMNLGEKIKTRTMGLFTESIVEETFGDVATEPRHRPRYATIE
ncbi:hypothetical protein Golob_018176, partial [Gossypium lobatum]|nr:hypothetical protein [Gossypium lobatum]